MVSLKLAMKLISLMIIFESHSKSPKKRDLSDVLEFCDMWSIA